MTEQIEELRRRLMKLNEDEIFYRAYQKAKETGSLNDFLKAQNPAELTKRKLILQERQMKDTEKKDKEKKGLQKGQKPGKQQKPPVKGRGKKNAPEIGLYSSRIKFTHPYTGEEVFLHREPEGAAFALLDAEEEDW